MIVKKNKIESFNKYKEAPRQQWHSYILTIFLKLSSLFRSLYIAVDKAYNILLLYLFIIIFPLNKNNLNYNSISKFDQYEEWKYKKKDLKNKSRKNTKIYRENKKNGSCTASCAEIDMDEMQCNFLADAIKKKSNNTCRVWSNTKHTEQKIAAGTFIIYFYWNFSLIKKNKSGNFAEI